MANPNRNFGEPKVITISPMPPEMCAYALARYSRSPDSITESIKWVHSHSSQDFLKKFYFDYGHASIADLGHLVMCFENISELCAINIEDEQLWDGQAKSSRYQNFSSCGYYIPENIDSESKKIYIDLIENLLSNYKYFYEKVRDFYISKYPKPDNITSGKYEKTIDARTFDVVRYFLPLAIYTNIGQVVSIRTFEKQVGRLLISDFEEIKKIAQKMLDSAKDKPLNTWNELEENKIKLHSSAPTLSTFAKENNFLKQITIIIKNYIAKNKHLFETKDENLDEKVILIEPHSLLDEIVSTLIYKHSTLSYRKILSIIKTLPDIEKETLLDKIYEIRQERDELPREFRSGYNLIFDILVDIGAFRDLHRHRRCQQIIQEFNAHNNYETPDILYNVGLINKYREVMEKVKENINKLTPVLKHNVQYLIPFAFRTRVLFKMDFSEADYICRLRTSPKGHFSYRYIAWLMKNKIEEKYPVLGKKIKAMHPDEGDFFHR